MNCYLNDGVVCVMSWCAASMASRCGLERSCFANAVFSCSARTMLFSRKADSCCSRRWRICLACRLRWTLRSFQISVGSGPKESTAFAVSGGSVPGSVVTDKAKNALRVIIAGSEEIVFLILFVFLPFTAIHSSLRPPPYHSSSLILYRGTKGISITSLQMQ